MSAGIDLMRDNSVFKIPVHLIQSSEDILTPEEVFKAYFDHQKALEKRYYLLPETAHSFNRAVLETQYKIIEGFVVIG